MLLKGPLLLAVARRTRESDRATGGAPRQRALVDATRRSETPTLRDRRRWSYAPCGLLLALASERPIHRWHNDAERQEESIPSHAPDGAGDFGCAPQVMRCR